VATPEQKAKVLALAQDLPRVWHAPTTQAKDRKRMLRSLLKDITVEKPSPSKQLLVHLRWQGGASTELTVQLPLPIADRVRYPAALVDRVRELAHGLPDAEIGNQLNREGHASPKGKPYTTRIVRWIRWRYQIPPVQLQRPEELTVQQVAQHFGVNKYVVYYWIKRSLIHARRLNQRMPYWITLTGSDEQKLQNRVRNSSRLQKAKYPQTILRKVHYETPVPYGQDRLVPIWLATLALQQKSRMVHFDSPSQLFDYFRLRKDGSQYRRMRAAFQRVFAATIFFGSEDQHTRHRLSTGAGSTLLIRCSSVGIIVFLRRGSKTSARMEDGMLRKPALVKGAHRGVNGKVRDSLTIAPRA